jgi:4a-hydroxytetrahydrobiopterin dehydratase
MSKLAEKTCVSCHGGVPPLGQEQSSALLREVTGWQVVDNHHLVKKYKFRNFAQALEFVNRVGAVAEEQNHHPDIVLAWGKVEVTVWTHKINGLTESDFIFAAKIDALPTPAGRTKLTG